MILRVEQAGYLQQNLNNSPICPVKNSHGIYKSNTDFFSFKGKNILPIKLRKTTLEDVPDILNLLKENNEYKDYWGQGINFLKKSIGTDFSHMIILNKNDNIIGHFHLQIDYIKGRISKLIENCYTKLPEGTLLDKAVIYMRRKMCAGKKNLWLNSISVSPNYRGKKIGHQMMLTIFNQAVNLNFKKISLTVEENNEVAKNLYKKFGFDFKQKINNYYGEGKNAYLMETSDITNPEFIKKLEKLKQEIELPVLIKPKDDK